MKNASDYWSTHLAAIEQRGISIAEYAREHDLSAQSLYGWRNRLSQAMLPTALRSGRGLRRAFGVDQSGRAGTPAGEKP